MWLWFVQNIPIILLVFQGWKGPGLPNLSFTFCFIPQTITLFTLLLNLVYWFSTWLDEHYASIYTKLVIWMDITLAFILLYRSLYENCCMTESLWWYCSSNLPCAWSNVWASTTLLTNNASYLVIQYRMWNTIFVFLFFRIELQTYNSL